MSRRWLQTRERSNILAIRMLVWIALFLGRRVARLVLFPVAAYFLVFGRSARQASRIYLSRVSGRTATFRDVFRHFYTFATVALDRVYFLSDRWSLFDIRYMVKICLSSSSNRRKAATCLVPTWVVSNACAR